MGRNTETVNAPDINNPGRIVLRRSSLQQRGNQLGDVEDTVEVQREDPGPGRGGIFLIRSGPV